MKRIICIISLVYFISLSAMAEEIAPKDSSNLKTIEYPSSLKDLIHQFKGKVIYFDVMASWCKPCIAELQQSKYLDSFFEENNVITIYVTIDQKQDIDKCISLLNKYDAKGYLVPHAAPADVVTTFPSDIEKLFLRNEKGDISISIPKYAIVDKEGNIVVKRAKRPSHKDALIEQLKEWTDK